MEERGDTTKKGDGHGSGEKRKIQGQKGAERERFGSVTRGKNVKVRFKAQGVLGWGKELPTHKHKRRRRANKSNVFPFQHREETGKIRTEMQGRSTWSSRTHRKKRHRFPQAEGEKKQAVCKISIKGKRKSSK